MGLLLRQAREQRDGFLRDLQAAIAKGKGLVEGGAIANAREFLGSRPVSYHQSVEFRDLLEEAQNTPIPTPHVDSDGTEATRMFTRSGLEDAAVIQQHAPPVHTPVEAEPVAEEPPRLAEPKLPPVLHVDSAGTEATSLGPYPEAIQILESAGALPRFSVYYPKEVKPRVLYKLLAYMHLASLTEVVRVHSEGEIGEMAAKQYQTTSIKSPEFITPGAKVTIIPQVFGVKFSPPSDVFVWSGASNHAVFHFSTNADILRSDPEGTADGAVAFYVGIVLVAEVRISIRFSTASSESLASTSAQPYRAVFVSYSHKDKHVVDQLEKSYTVLGMQYLRDVRMLRSGEAWNEALLNKIEEADVFQLCWSYAAKSSVAVEREWQHALSLGRSSFIRPVYWQRPMPDCPSELARIHFAYLDVGWAKRLAGKLSFWWSQLPGTRR